MRDLRNKLHLDLIKDKDNLRKYILRHPHKDVDTSDILVAHRLDKLCAEEAYGDPEDPDDYEPIQLIDVVMNLENPGMNYAIITLQSVIKYCIAERISLQLSITHDGMCYFHEDEILTYN